MFEWIRLEKKQKQESVFNPPTDEENNQNPSI